VDHLSLSELALFVLATFGAATVAGLVGFAFGLIAGAIWLHFLPVHVMAILIAGFGLLIQGMAAWKLRHALNWPRLLPFLLGGTIGVPLGGQILRYASAGQLRTGVAAIMVAYSLYGLARPRLPTIRAGGRAADGAVGLASGVLGGATGLSGILNIIWCGLRGWPMDQQRAVFQPAMVATFAAIVLWFAGTGRIGGSTLTLLALGAPAVWLGSRLGLKLYGRLDEMWFRRLVLALLLLSGLTLLF